MILIKLTQVWFLNFSLTLIKSIKNHQNKQNNKVIPHYLLLQEAKLQDNPVKENGLFRFYYIKTRNDNFLWYFYSLTNINEIELFKQFCSGC